MMPAELAATINQRVGCPACGACASWKIASRANVRANAVLYRFGCTRCGEQVVLKLARMLSQSQSNESSLKVEYQALLDLNKAFLSDNRRGTLTPVSYVEFGGYEGIITRIFRGADLICYARSANIAQLREAYRCAGALLRGLHDACPRGYELRSLDVEPKLEHLDEKYGFLMRADPEISKAVAQMHDSSSRISRPALKWSWAHGDFKPDNVLYDGCKMIVFDTRLDTRGAFVYDLASLLNHALLADYSFAGWRTLRHYQNLEAEFLAGYGVRDEAEMAALRWCQLYFMLRYFGRFARRGGLMKSYAKWRISPLIRDIGGKLGVS